MVSMKDIARECGVSVATVSKALNDYSDIGKPTRDKVRKMAEQLGYFPNSSARALKTKRTYNLGVLFTDAAHSGLTHDFFSHILESFKVTAEANGYDITFTTRSIAARKTTFLEHCRYRGVDGVVIANIDFYDSNILELISSDLPIVTIDHEFDGRIAVISDNYNGIRMLLEYIIGKGHKKIAYIHGDGTSPVTRARLKSFMDTMAEHGLEVPDDYVRTISYRDVKAAGEATAQLLDLPEPPTCILCPDDISCIGGINEMQARKLAIGKDISIAGYDGVYVSQIMSPQITTIWQDTRTIGKMAAEKLISLIEDPANTPIDRIVVKGRLLEGGSVADLTA